MKKSIFIVIIFILLIIFFALRKPTEIKNEIAQKPIYQPNTPEYIQQVHQEQIERGEGRRFDLWNANFNQKIITQIHDAALKCFSFKLQKPIGNAYLIFSINMDGSLNNFELDPSPPDSSLNQNCLTQAYGILGTELGSREGNRWGRDRFQASEFVNQK